MHSKYNPPRYFHESIFEREEDLKCLGKCLFQAEENICRDQAPYLFAYSRDISSHLLVHTAF
jgi:hypothetical protein